LKTEDLPSFFRISSEVEQAIELGLPVVALESTVITHGLPYPENATLAQDMESQVRGSGCVPATIAVLDGLIHVGLDTFQLDRIATTQGLEKISARDFAGVVSRGGSGGTTVAGTLLAAQVAGIRVFATGGIGGVHRDPPMDVSADLTHLASTPVIVVCSGAKAILDLPATLEYLETHSVPVVGYQTGEFPAFYSRRSGLPVSVRANSPDHVLIIASAHWALGMSSAVLVAVPPPEEVAIPRKDIQGAIDQALQEMRELRLRGQQVTPFLLQRVNELTGGASLRANLGLLRRNAEVAGQIAALFAP
jgi:pseudouridine-5'-phosphate glycosidase